jgi:hypothetical protein
MGVSLLESFLYDTGGILFLLFALTLICLPLWVLGTALVAAFVKGKSIVEHLSVPSYRFGFRRSLLAGKGPR